VPQPAAPKLTKAVLYARVSSGRQEVEGFSIPAQVRLLRDHAGRHGFLVVEEFVESETAGKEGRAAFNAMLAFLRRAGNDCRTILVEKTDRLYRNVADWVTLDQVDVEIHLVKEGSIISKDSRSHDTFMHGIRVLMAKQFIDNLKEETTKGMREKAQQGLYPSRAPYGYRNADGPHGKRVIVPDPDVAPVVRQLFELYATGRFSVKELASHARTVGLRAPLARGWLDKTTIHRILTSKVYRGDFDWRGRTYAGVHAPLVSRELWDQVQDALHDRLALRRKRSRHDFAYNGLVTCRHCTCAVGGQLQKGRYVYYHCSGFKGRCPERYVREEVLFEQFAQALDALAFDGQILAWLVDELLEGDAEARQAREAAVARLEAQVHVLERRLEAAAEHLVDGRIPPELYDRKTAEWRAELDRLFRTIQDHRSDGGTYLAETARLVEVSARAAELFRQQDPREGRRFLAFVVSNSVWGDGSLTVEWRQPFDILAEAVAVQERKKAAGSSPAAIFQAIRPQRDLNPCRRRERAVSWAGLDDGDLRAERRRARSEAGEP
jgi:site-specific DNA recombinase